MDLTYVDEKNLKTLEDYAVTLVTGMLTIRTLLNQQIQSINAGILTEDLSCRTNTIAWDLKRMLKLYQDQTESVLEMIPDDFNVEKIIDGLKSRELTKARSMI